MCWLALASLSWICTTTQAQAPVQLATAPERTAVTVLLGTAPDALVQEVRRAALPEGETSLLLSWAGTRLVADSLRLTPAEADAPLEISGPVLLADRPQHAEWTITSPRVADVDLLLTYAVQGLTWRPEYTIHLDAPAGRLSLEALAAIVNGSGEDFEDASINLGIGATVTADLEAGATVRLPYVTAADVACDVLCIHDAATNADSQLRLDVTNNQESGLGAAPLPAGKARIYQDGAGQTLLTGEVNLPYMPVGATAEVILGTAREVLVERRVLRTQQVDVKKDVHGRLALWNQEDEIALLIESLKDGDVLLRITERIEGEWKMLSNSHEFEQIDAEHVEFVVPVPAHGELQVKYKVRRLNLIP